MSQDKWQTSYHRAGADVQTADAAAGRRNPPEPLPGGFSVLMATYLRDDPVLLQRAVDSVFINSLPPQRLVLVADGPLGTGLEKMVESIQARYRSLTFVRLPYNQGLSHALNHGMRFVETEWVARADSDDINLPERFEAQTHFLRENPEVTIVGGAILEVDRDGRQLSVRACPPTHDAIMQRLPRRNPLNHMTVMFRTDRFHECGGYPHMHLREDYALWANMATKTNRFANLHDVLVRATTGADMFRRRGGLRYALGELELQQTLVKLGLKSATAGLTDGLLRASVFLAPGTLRSYIYTRILRLTAGTATDEESV